MADFVTVGATADLAPGRGKVVAVGGLEIALINVGGTFHALENACPHRGGPLGEGLVDGDTVTCPWHNWSFRVRTGRHVMTPEVAVRVYEVRVVGPDVQVKLP